MSRHEQKIKDGAARRLAGREQVLATLIAAPRGSTQQAAGSMHPGSAQRGPLVGSPEAQRAARRLAPGVQLPGTATPPPTHAGGPTGLAADALTLQRSIGNRATGAVLQRRKNAPPAKPRMVKLRVKPPRRMNGREFSAFVLAQLEGISFDEAVVLLPEAGWNYQTGRFLTGITDDDVKKEEGIEVTVEPPEENAALKEDRQARAAEFKGVTGKERESVNTEVDRRFWKRKGQKGKRLGLGADQQADRELWMRTRDEVLLERQRVTDMPEEVKAHLFGEGGAALRPEQYKDVIRIGETMRGFSDEDWDAYERRATATTDDLELVEGQLKAFVAKQAAARKVIDRVKGTERLYDIVKRFNVARLRMGMEPKQYPKFPEWKEMNDLLAKHGFQGIWDYERATAAYLTLFQERAKELTMLVLAASTEAVYKEQKRYADPAAAAGLQTELGRFRELHAEAVAADRAIPKRPTKGRNAEPGPWPGDLEKMADARAKHARAGAERERLAEFHPILKDTTLSDEELDVGSGGDLRTVLLETTEARLRNIIRTKKRVKSDRDAVLQLDQLLELAFEELGAAKKDSVGRKIVRTRKDEIAEDKEFRNDALTVVAIGLGFVSFGGGAAAVLAGAASLGVGGYQAANEYAGYQDAYAASHTAFDPAEAVSSNEPSFAWVALALIGMGLETLALKNAIRAFRPAAEALAATGDIAAFRAQLTNVKLDDALKARVAGHVEAEQQLADAAAGLRKEWKELMDAPRGIPGTMTTHGNLIFYGKVTALAYRAARLKVRTWRQFLRFLKVRRLLQDVDLEALAAEDLKLVQKAFKRGVELSDKAHVKIPQDEPIPVDPHSPKGPRRRDVGDVNPPARGTVPQVLGGADPRTARRGGIEKIEQFINDNNENVVVIEGRLLKGMNRKSAPNYNRDPEWTIHRAEQGLEGWQAAHLWGPGFGDEAAAGMFLSTFDMNQLWQNPGIEGFLRNLRRLAARQGGIVRLRATATSYARTQYGGVALKDVKYEFSVVTGSKVKPLAKVEIHADPPPGGAVHKPDIKWLSEDDL
jgi:hypothetical protein